MNDSKAPKWFQEFETKIMKEIQEIKNAPTMRRELNTKGD